MVNTCVPQSISAQSFHNERAQVRHGDPLLWHRLGLTPSPHPETVELESEDHGGPCARVGLCPAWMWMATPKQCPLHRRHLWEVLFPLVSGFQDLSSHHEGRPLVLTRVTGHN